MVTKNRGYMKVNIKNYQTFRALCDDLFREINFHLETYIGFETPFKVKAKENKFECTNTEKKRKVVLSVGDKIAMIHLSDKYGDIVKLEYDKPHMVSFGNSPFKQIQGLIKVCNEIHKEVSCKKK